MSIVATTTSLAIGAGVAYWGTRKKREALKLELDARFGRVPVKANNPDAAVEKAQALREELSRTLAIREAELKSDEEQLVQQQHTIERRVAVFKERDERLAEQFENIKSKKEEVALLREELEHLDKLVIAETEKVAGACSAR